MADAMADACPPSPSPPPRLHSQRPGLHACIHRGLHACIHRGRVSHCLHPSRVESSRVESSRVESSRVESSRVESSRVRSGQVDHAKAPPTHPSHGRPSQPPRETTAPPLPQAIELTSPPSPGRDAISHGSTERGAISHGSTERGAISHGSTGRDAISHGSTATCSPSRRLTPLLHPLLHPLLQRNSSLAHFKSSALQI